MGLFAKKDEVPKIAASPVLPELPAKRNVASGLPSLPGNSSHSNINQEMIKSAVNDNSSEEYEVTSEEMEHHSMDEGIPLPPSYSEKLEEIGSGEIKPSGDGSIFVKIDKFRRAQGVLKDIESKAKEISTEINTLKEVKIREIRELNAWDEELKSIHVRLSKIDSSIFGEV